MIDLHTHTTASDGTDSPFALVKKALATGVTTLGITDHDSTAGWAEAVTAIHILRGNPGGVALQVFIAESKVALGITPTLTIQQQEILDKFWPGLLSVTVRAQPGLTWNLGDERRLGKVNIRVPNRKFINAILQQSGPLAISSAALIGSETILDLANLPVYESDISAVFNEGALNKGELSTWLEFSEKEITLKRIGAIGIEQLLPLIPTISTPNL